MNDLEFIEWCHRLKVSEQCRMVIERIRTSPPSRNVGTGTKNVCGKYPSKKMGMTIQFESHTVELAAIYDMEHDQNILEFYDQPSPIKIRYPSKNERIVSIYTTPDFFVVCQDCAGWEEWKTEEELIKLAFSSPHRYVKRPDGSWSCPPGEEYAAQYGLYYRLRSSSEINWTYQRNIRFLQDYIFCENHMASELSIENVRSIVKENPGLTLKRLLENENVFADDVYFCIVNQDIYVDIYHSTIATPEKVPVFLDEETSKAFKVISSRQISPINLPLPLTLAAGSRVLWDGNSWLILNVGQNNISLFSESDQYSVDLNNEVFRKLVDQNCIKGINVNAKSKFDEVVTSIFSQASPRDLKEANNRYYKILPALSRNQESEDLSINRTMRSWVKKYKDAQQVYGNGYIGLLPGHKNKGNRTPKLPLETVDLMNTFVKDEYETIKQKTKKAVYGQLICACEKLGIEPPSYKSFVKAVNHRPEYEQKLKREGRKAAYVHEEFYWELSTTTPRHGDRPFEIAHIDHTELIIELKSSINGINLNKPWLTIMIDAYSRKLLSFYITFEKPSYRSCMMVLRECVRKQGRLPETIVVDRGSEFGSVYFETFLAQFEVTKKTRPSAKARFGSVCERLFNTTQTQFITNLVGNTQSTLKNVRHLTPEINPKNNAVWTLEYLYQSFSMYAYEVYDTMEHISLGETPRQRFNRGLCTSGTRPYRIIPYDKNFIIHTLPTTKKGTAKVSATLGIRVNGFKYWSNSFRNPKVIGTQVPVRYDPFNMGIAYAFVSNQWVECKSEYYSILNGRSEFEIKILSQEYRRQNRISNSYFTISAKKIAQFIQTTDKTESLLVQCHQAIENKRMFDVIEGGVTSKEYSKFSPSPHEITSVEFKLNLDSVEPFEEY